MAYPDCGPCMNGECRDCIGLCGCIEAGCRKTFCNHFQVNEANKTKWLNQLREVYPNQRTF